MLRAFTRPPPAGPVTVAPHGGTLVLFDSVAVEHEVTPTRRERWALVGWFLDGRKAQGATRPRHKKAKKRTKHPMRMKKYR